MATDELSAAQLEAYDNATNAVVAYLQTVADLYTGEREALADLAAVAVAPELGVAQRSISQARALGYRSEPAGARVVLVSAEPYRIDVDASPRTVDLKACVDATEVSAISPSGIRRSGLRQRFEYRVVQVDTLPAPGWAVSQVTNEKPADRAC